MILHSVKKGEWLDWSTLKDGQAYLIIDARANEDNPVFHEVAKHVYDILCICIENQPGSMLQAQATSW